MFVVVNTILLSSREYLLLLNGKKKHQVIRSSSFITKAYCYDSGGPCIKRGDSPNLHVTKSSFDQKPFLSLEPPHDIDVLSRPFLLPSLQISVPCSCSGERTCASHLSLRSNSFPCGDSKLSPQWVLVS